MGSPWINPDPAAGPFGWCMTTGDEISVRIDPASFNTTLDAALMRFNASWVRMDVGPQVSGVDCTTTPGIYTTGHHLEMDWWVEVDGVVMFSESVRVGDDDACWLDHTTEAFMSGGVLVPAAAWWVVHWDHDLTVTESWAMRNALNSTNASDVTLHWVCLNGPCDFLQDNVPGLSGSDFFFRVEMEYYSAEDSMFFIKGAMLTLAAANILIALGSTPFWNPMRAWMKGAEF